MDQIMENREADQQHQLYLRRIKSLKELQKIDDRIYEKRQLLEIEPRELEEKEAELAQKQQDIERYQDRINHLREQEAMLRRNMEEESERLRKSKDKLMDTQNEREYNAVTREIDTIEKMAQPREVERVTLLDEQRRIESIIEEKEPDYLALKAEVEEKRQSLAEKMAVLEKDLALDKAEREEKCKDVPDPILERYEFIRGRLEHPVIVSLTEAVCPSCHIALPPQTFNELLRGIDIKNCPSCQRIIVWRDHYIADDPEAQAAAAREQENGRHTTRKPSMGRSAALDKGDYKEEREDVSFVSSADVLDDELHHMGDIESTLDSMSTMANVSDLTDMTEMTGLDGLSDETEESEPEK